VEDDIGRHALRARQPGPLATQRLEQLGGRTGGLARDISRLSPEDLSALQAGPIKRVKSPPASIH
jgi:hypothetical protein